MGGTMIVDAIDGTKTFEWNGVPEEREQVKAEFDSLMGSGAFLAYAAVVDEASGATTKATAIKDFDDPAVGEATEVRLTPRLAGG